MTLTRWSLVDKLSRLLEPDERDAVLGDFAESNASFGQVLGGVVGLVIRRQAALWKDWRPWLALVGLIVPVGMQLNQMAIRISAALTIHLRIYWRHGVRYENGLTAFEETAVVLSQALALLVWSWTTGFVLAVLSRRSVWITGPLYFLVCAYHLPLVLFFLFRIYVVNRQPVDLLLFVTLSIPIILLTLLWLLPSILGLRRGLQNGALKPAQTIALAAAIVGLTALATWTGGFGRAALIRWSGGEWDPSLNWLDRLLPLAVASWPVGYLLGVAISRRETKTLHS